jgi:transcriptional accessory protein Tex/SPT6
MESQEVKVEQEQGSQPPVEAVTASQPGASAAPESASAPAAPRAAKPKAAPALDLESLKPGTTMKGKVRNVVEFGAFIDIGAGRDGLAHISVLKKAGVDKTLKVGDVIEVVVRRVDMAEQRISLALPEAESEAKTPLQDLQVATTVTGHVVRLADFGAFVDIGAQADGLLHVSQLSNERVNHPSDVLKVGDEVQVRILEVDPTKRRISLTMKEPSAAPAERSYAPPVERRAAPTERRSAPERRGASERRAASGGDRQTYSSQDDATSAERFPTAFEEAFEKARVAARRQQRRARA